MRRWGASAPAEEGYWLRAYHAAYGVAASWTKDADEREAIAQEAVVRCYLNSQKPTFQAIPARVEPWAGGYARNVVRERLRRQARAPTPLGELSLPEPASDWPGPEEAAQAGERLRALHSAIAKLPEPHRTIATLRVQDVPPRDIASYLGQWREIGLDEARRLGKETRRMLRLALSGEDLPSSFPRKFSKKNPWNTTPRPFSGHRDVGRAATTPNPARRDSQENEGEPEMAGELVPLVLVPRYSSFVGAHDFTTIGMDVTNYSKAIVNVWRSELLGTSPTFAVEFQESTDQSNWTVCTNGTSADPGSNSEAQYTPELNKRWFRIKITLTGTGPAASAWAIGFLEMREN